MHWRGGQSEPFGIYKAAPTHTLKKGAELRQKQRTTGSLLSIHSEWIACLN